MTLEKTDKKSRKKISLVLSGGGARGIAHIGVIEELEKQGYQIHAIAGSSMGALVGGIYAAGKLKEFKEWILELDKMDVFKLIDFTLIRNGFVKGDKVFNKLKEFVPDINIEDLSIAYFAIATDVTNKKEFVFNNGNLLKAMRASVAIPNVLTPVKMDEMILIDGGVINNIPLNHAKRSDDDLLIAVNVNANIPVPKRLDQKVKNNSSFYNGLLNKFKKSLHKVLPTEKKDLGYFDIMNDSFEIMRNELVRLALEKTPPNVLIETPHDLCSIYDFYKADVLIETGRIATEQSLNAFRESNE